MPVLVASVALFLLRRLRPTGVAVIAYRIWRRLPPAQRRQLLLAARRNGPRIAASIVARARPRG